MHAAKPLFFFLLRLSGLSSEMKTALPNVSHHLLHCHLSFPSAISAGETLQLCSAAREASHVRKDNAPNAAFPQQSASCSAQGEPSPTTGAGCSKQQMSQQKSRDIKGWWYSKYCQPHISEMPDNSALLPHLPLQSWNVTI